MRCKFKGRELDEFVDVRISQPMKSGIRLTDRFRIRFPVQLPAALISEKLEFCGNNKKFRDYLQKSFRSISAQDFKECLKAATELNPSMKDRYSSGIKLFRTLERFSKTVIAKA